MGATDDKLADEYSYRLRAMKMEAHLRAMQQRVDPTVLLREKLKATEAKLDKVMNAVKIDLKRIRSFCPSGQTCDCAPDMPSTACPHNLLHATMSAIIQMALDGIERD